MIDGKFVPTNEKSKQDSSNTTSNKYGMPRRIVDLKGRLAFSDDVRDAFRKKLHFLPTESLGLPDPHNYPQPGRPTMRIAADVDNALWEFSRRVDEQTLILDDIVQTRIQEDGKLDPEFEKALPTMRRQATERDQEAVEALVMLAYAAIARVEQLPIERLRPIAQHLDEWPVLACRHPVARKDVELILTELDVGSKSTFQTMKPTARWNWKKDGADFALHLFRLMPHNHYFERGEVQELEKTLGRLCKRNARSWRAHYRRLFDRFWPEARNEPKLRRLVVRDDRADHVTWVKKEWQAKIFDRVWSCLVKILK